jgi:pilus assembly protein Flp/PilA
MGTGSNEPARFADDRALLARGKDLRTGSLSLLPKLKGLCTMAILAQFLNNEDGATAIEYALIASLIAVVIVAAVQVVGTQVSTVFTEVGAALK